MKKTKKIVFKLREFPHLSETFIIAQINTAIELGYEISILIHKLLDVTESKHEGLLNKYQLLDKIIIEDYKIPKNKIVRIAKWMSLLALQFSNINYIIKFHNEKGRFSFTWLYQWVFYKQFNEVSIFHAQYGTSSNTLTLLKKTGFFKPAVVVTFHGHDAFFPINGFIPNNGYYDNLFKYGNLITANTPYLAGKIIELGCPVELISIVPVGVDTDFFYPNNDQIVGHKTLKLITVGRLDKVKGHDFCIEAVRNLIYQGIDVTLTIVGEGAEGSHLERLIAGYKLEDKVFMKGKKSQLEVRQELWEHDLYLLTAVALSDGRRETQGLATLEAQACGLPAVVFNSGGVKYTVEDGVSGFVCEEYDSNGISTAVLKFIENPYLLMKMSSQAVTFVNKNFSQRKIDEKWGNIYSNLSNGK